MPRPATSRDRQERLVALDAATGKTLWERLFPVYLTDIPAHRVAWASPSVDPATGNIFTFGGNAHLRAFSPDGKPLWERSLIEEYGAVTTHGGRAVSPVVDGDRIIVSTLISAWGTLGRGGNRYFAFDKKTGQTVWISSPQARHWDTNYSTPIIATVGGVRLAIVGGTDGVYHAIKAATGEPVWKLDVSKRAINNSMVMVGTDVDRDPQRGELRHQRDGPAHPLRRLAQGRDQEGADQVVPATACRSASRRRSPTRRTASSTRSTTAPSCSASTSRPATRCGPRSSARMQKGSPVLADGKLYVGTENGRVYILKPSKTGVEVLDDDALPHLHPGGHRRRRARPRADRRLAGRRQRPRLHRLDGRALRDRPEGAEAGAGGARRDDRGPGAAAAGPATIALVFPSDVTLTPGKAQKFTVNLFDANGNPAPTPAGTTIAWAAEGLKGTAAPDGTFTPDAAAGSQGGALKATVGALSAHRPRSASR